MKKILILFVSSMLVFAACRKATPDLKSNAVLPAAQTTVNAATSTNPATPVVLSAKFSYTAPDPINIFEHQPITFTNESTGAVKSVWEFGNATKSSENSPVMSYDWHGYYTVKLTVHDAAGNSSSVTKDVSILCLFANGIHPPGSTHQ